MRKIYYVLLFAIVTIYSTSNVKAQVSIDGPTCVVPNTVYSYKISGLWRDSSKLQICITGGSLAARDSSIDMPNCTPQNGAPLGVVNVLWDGSGAASLSANSDIGSGSLNVAVINPLAAGTIDSENKQQLISADSIPMEIVCNPDSGGHCTPTYLHQWQQSFDAVDWTDISTATANNLSFISKLAQSTFFRRKTSEVNSGTIVYSNIASVFLIPAQQWADSSHASDSATFSMVIRSRHQQIVQSVPARLPHLNEVAVGMSRSFFRRPTTNPNTL